jgi:diguanylate cyclase (GGDEF)-like protein
VRAARSIALGFSLVQMTPAKPSPSFDYSGFWTRSLNTAVAAKELSLVAGLRSEEEAFLAGLLQDIGAMIIGHLISCDESSIEQYAGIEKVLSPDIERELFGIDHIEVARVLFEKWNFPACICIPVLCHHDPEEAKGAGHDTMLSVRIQHLAGCIGAWLYSHSQDEKYLNRLHDMASRDLSIPVEELNALMRRIDARTDELLGILELRSQRPATYSALLEKANAALGDIVSEQEYLLRELEAAKAESRKLTEQLRTANLQLLQESRTDSLTGLANRKRFEEFLQKELDRSFRYKRPISVLFVDLDNLKRVNDTHGHLEGSNLLKHVGEILKQNIRGSDLAARYGGDEFVAAVVETCGADAFEIAERIRQSIMATPYRTVQTDQEIRLSASLGVTSWEPSDLPTHIKSLIEQADSAMYQAKRAGKNCVALFESSDKPAP